MNIKIFTQTFILCMFTLLASEFSTFKMFTTTQASSTTQQETFLEYIQKLIGHLFNDDNETNILPPDDVDAQDNLHEKESTKPLNIDISLPNQENNPKFSTPLTRNEALEIIRSITGKIFDIDDPYHISMHLDDLKILTSYLDPIVDQKTITAIHFLIENQHRSTYLDTIFWIKNIKEKELDTSIPVTENIFNMPKTEKLKILRAKLAAKKEEKISI